MLLPLLCLLIPLLPNQSFAAGDEHGADIGLAIDRDGPFWVGERISVNLEIWTDALSFSAQSFQPPEVKGGFLVSADSSTIKLSERRGDETWQGLRYTLDLYPQREGRITIPEFDVHFSTGMGYGSESQSHLFTTPSVSVEARLPPGAQPGGLLVSSTNFTMEAAWEPLPDDSGVVELKTGDALVLTLTRRARGVPAMVFEPLPDWQFDGLGVYEDTPTVRDDTDRGSLTGTRIDRVTLVCEQPGRYELPELAFHSWNPETEQLDKALVSGPVLNVSENPAWAAAAIAETKADGFLVDWRYLWLLPAAGLLYGFLWPLLRMMLRWFRRELAARPLQPLNPERKR
jgi:hypothetical protein